MGKSIIIKFAVLFLVIALSGCASYYKKTQQFHSYISTGKMDKANEWLNKDEKREKGKNKVLYYFDRGYVSWVLEDYNKSNEYFTTADRLIEEQIKNYGLEALSLITNPMIKPYKAEDFETVMVNFFMSMNYLQLEKYNDAIVECKRINIKLNQLNDKYKDHKNRYQRDAFSHNLMGIIYEANRDYNNAFIAYRNAYNVYESDYKKYFGLNAPIQLKKDLLRSAYLTGFYDEVRFYEKKFNMKYSHQPSKNGDLVFFWLNGFGPVKSEWGINFTTLPGEDGFVTFHNEEMDLTFPFYIGNSPEKGKFSDLSFLRVTFPKYVERPVYYQDASILSEGRNYKLEMAQNINEIAFKTLKDRMLRELSHSLLRLATKKIMEEAARRESGNLGALVSIANALTEKADTRNWQTLPYSISYTRIPLKEGDNTITLKAQSQSNVFSKDFIFQGIKGKTQFHYFHNLESIPPRIEY